MTLIAHTRLGRLATALAALFVVTSSNVASAGYTTMTAAVIPPAGTILVTYEVTGSSPTPGSFPLADQIGLYAQGAPDGSYLNTVYVPAGRRGGIVSMPAPTTQGVYEVRYQPYANGYVTTWTFPFMVLSANYALSAPATVVGGTSFAVTYAVPTGAPAPLGGSLRDQIALYQPNADDGLYETFAFVPGGPRTGSVSLTAPATPGVYQIRYQPYANGFRSTVVGAVTVLPPAAQPYTLSAPPSVSADSAFQIGFTVPAIAPLPQAFPFQDYVALYAPGAPDGMYLRFAYVPAGQASGTVELVAPGDPGDYELRYHSLDSAFHSDASLPLTVTDSLFGPIVKIQGLKLDENGKPDLVAVVDPTGPGATCGPFPYQSGSQSKKSKACGPQVNPFELRSRVSTRGYTTLKTRFQRGKDVIVSLCGGDKPYECKEHPPTSFCRPPQGSTGAKLKIFVPPVPPAYVDMWLAYVPESQATTYPPCDDGSFPAVIRTSAISTGTLGDVNGDGFITATDGVLALRCSAQLPLAGDCTRGDMNCSGATTVTDGVIILNLAAGNTNVAVCGTNDPCHNADACAGKNCGTATNVCMQTIGCGECGAPTSCGSCGTPGVCSCCDPGFCNGKCGQFTDHCGQVVACNDPNACPCPSNACGQRTCGTATDCHGNTVQCGPPCSICPQPGQEFRNAVCGGTTGLQCCGWNCNGIPGINSTFHCIDPCGNIFQDCCHSGWNGDGRPFPCNGSLTCKPEGLGGPSRCLP